MKSYFLDEPFIYKKCLDLILRRCIHEVNIIYIFKTYHDLEYGGHFRKNKIVAKISQCEFYWLTKLRYAHEYVK